IAPRTMKRLRTLATYDRLGAGFEISAADLDQRGAGDLLSDTQAGHMKLIGVDLYQHLFEAAINQARGQADALWMPEINMTGAGFLPPDWIPDADIRLGLYVRLAHSVEEGDLEALEDELADRFGPLPPPAQDLMAAARVAILARAAGIARIDAGPAAIALTPHGKNAPPPDGSGLEEKAGRWLLKERTDDQDRGARVIDLLETLNANGS
ncbi:MAG: TRCF domain-containing protein, partial [Sphingobium sp.]